MAYGMRNVENSKGLAQAPQMNEHVLHLDWVPITRSHEAS